jgi:hypothetical protein
LNDLSGKRENIRKVVLSAIGSGKAKNNGLLGTSRKVKLDELFEETTSTNIDGWLITELFDLIQGVTWGGEGCEEIYVVDKDVALSLESELLYKTVGGRDISASKIDWKENYLVFPYIKAVSKWTPAFRNTSLGGDDALDFSIAVSDYEKGKDIKSRLNYRIAKNLVQFPNVANYLAKNYERLEQREFEGKKLSQYNKSWYEYHRPRTPQLISKPKIVCKRVMREPAFAIDEKGYLPRDSVISMIPRKKINELKSNLESVLRHKLTTVQVLEYALAFLNSDLFQELLTRRRSKKRGGYPIVDERLLEKFGLPKIKVKELDSAKKILAGKSDEVSLRDLYKPIKKTQMKIDLQIE